MLRAHTQREQILAHLQSGNSIAPLEALSRFGCFRLSARIHELKREGFPVRREVVADLSGARFAKYRLAS